LRIIFLGTSSGVGKTAMSAMFCRYLRKLNVNVVPFKASNLSSSSYLTKDGEIGTGQALQAIAADLEPITDMNPILLKYSEDCVKTLVHGKPVSDNDRNLLNIVLESYDGLAKNYEAVVAEGSGSAAEINLRKNDIANIGFARERDVPAVLIGDIERGGVFAGLYGTWKLIDEKDRHLLKGFIINRFRGDSAILKKGTDRITELTGMKFLGVMPLIDICLPEEDILSSKDSKKSKMKDYMDDLDKLVQIAEKNLNLDLIVEIMRSSA